LLGTRKKITLPGDTAEPLSADNSCMEYVLGWGGKREDLLVILFGTATVEDLDAWVQVALSDARWSPPMRVLIDQRLVDWGRIGADEIERRVDMLALDSDRIGDSHVAIVAGSDLAFGLMRMEQAQIEGRVRHEFQVFRSIDEARAWLGQVRAEEELPVRAA
jgi:hypothetical protein